MTAKAELVAQMTKQLQVAQQQCRDLLDSSAVQELHQIKLQVQQLRAEKAHSEDRIIQLEVCTLRKSSFFHIFFKNSRKFRIVKFCTHFSLPLLSSINILFILFLD